MPIQVSNVNKVGGFLAFAVCLCTVSMGCNLVENDTTHFSARGAQGDDSKCDPSSDTDEGEYYIKLRTEFIQQLRKRTPFDIDALMPDKEYLSVIKQGNLKVDFTYYKSLNPAKQQNLVRFSALHPIEGASNQAVTRFLFRIPPNLSEVHMERVVSLAENIPPDAPGYQRLESPLPLELGMQSATLTQTGSTVMATAENRNRIATKAVAVTKDIFAILAYFASSGDNQSLDSYSFILFNTESGKSVRLIGDPNNEDAGLNSAHILFQRLEEAATARTGVNRLRALAPIQGLSRVLLKS